ncbi:MAG: peptidylprolyl isomerase, partial [Flavobacteriaceae bacterium]|nr:peptidylprolyl isomerase [Flavobacteriaceae bacterium]
MLNFSKLYLVLVILIFFLSSCDSDNNSAAVETNDYSEQLKIDNALLVDYLSSHFYNYEDFPRSENEIVSIEIDTISGDNANKIPLIDQVQQISVPLTDANNEIINHTLYYIVAQQGSELERKPAIVDSTYVAYKGELLSGYKFDERVSPVWFDNASVVSGFRYGLQYFAPGTYSVNESGIIRFQDFGQGIIFMPSGLGYYASGLAAIPNYSPLVFSVSVYTTNESDHDNDGILSKN